MWDAPSRTIGDQHNDPPLTLAHFSNRSAELQSADGDCHTCQQYPKQNTGLLAEAQGTPNAINARNPPT